MNDAPAGHHPAPDETALLGQVRRAWAEVLDLDSPQDVPVDVNFLEAGGSSLLLIMLWEELHPLTSRTLKVSDLFQHSTVTAQAAFLAAPATPAGGDDGGGTPDARAAAPGGRGRDGLIGRARRGQLVSE